MHGGLHHTWWPEPLTGPGSAGDEVELHARPSLPERMQPSLGPGATRPQVAAARGQGEGLQVCAATGQGGHASVPHARKGKVELAN